MEMWEKGRPGRLRLIVVFVCVLLGAASAVGAEPRPQAQQAAPNPATRPVGTIKSIAGKTIVLTTDAKSEVTVQVQDDAKLVRVEPGEKDLKNAVPLQLQDLQAGDRILVRGKLADDGKTVLAASIIAIKSGDIATKQAHERDEWQRHGVGGLVKSVDAARRHDHGIDKCHGRLERRDGSNFEADGPPPIRSEFCEIRRRGTRAYRPNQGGRPTARSGNQPLPCVPL